MSYRLEFKEPIPDGIKRIINEQIDKALYSLTESDESLEARIHDARKRFKKIRAVMRLVRDESGSDVYQRENTCYRDAGRQLADLRESTVAIETLDTILEHFSDELDESGFDDLRQKLVERHEAICEQVQDEKTVDDVVKTIQEASERIAELPVTHDDFSALHDGLRLVYKRGYKGIARAYDEPTPENFHEWRKRVKYLWYHMRILKPIWPDILDELADAVHDLADYLGDAHDCADFEQLLKEHPDLVENKETAQVLNALAKRWRKEWETAARPLGERIYAESPDDFMARMVAYWEATQREARQKA